MCLKKIYLCLICIDAFDVVFLSLCWTVDERKETVGRKTEQQPICPFFPTAVEALSHFETQRIESIASTSQKH